MERDQDEVPLGDVDQLTRARIGQLFARRVMQNSLRSMYVEPQVGVLLGADWRFVGHDWAAWDYESGIGQDRVRLEVKQSAALQSWHPPAEAMQPTATADAGVRKKTNLARAPKGRFDIAPRAGYYEGSNYTELKGRHNDIYVFAWHPLTVGADHTAVGQWQYFVVGTAEVEEAFGATAKTVGVGRLASTFAESCVGADGLRTAVEAVSAELRRSRAATGLHV